MRIICISILTYLTIFICACTPSSNASKDDGLSDAAPREDQPSKFSNRLNQAVKGGAGQRYWVPVNNDDDMPSPALTEHLSTTQNKIALSAKSGGLYVETVESEQNDYLQLTIPDTGISGNVGDPAIPFKGIYLEVPYGVDLETKIVSINTDRTILTKPVYPKQQPPTDASSDAPPFARNDDSYRQDRFFPESIVAIGDDGFIRGRRVIFLEVYPLQYNPNTGELLMHSDIRIDINLVGQRDSTEYRERERLQSEAFEQQAMRLIENYNQILVFPSTMAPRALGPIGSGDGADYLIITADAFQEEIQPLADWKTQKGYLTRIATVSEAGGSYTAIANYIQNAYDTWSPAPTYVLLVGDVSDLPSHYSSRTSISDLPYSLTDGSDYWPDVVVGRLSVSTEAECNTVVDKIMTYDKDPVPGTWYDHTLLAALFQDYNDNNCYADRYFLETTVNAKNYMEGTLAQTVYTSYVTDNYSCSTYRYRTDSSIFPHRPAHPATVPSDIVSLFLSQSAGTAAVSTAINNGVGFVMHRDHGSYTAWGDPHFTVSDIQSLSNGDMTPVVLSINCQTGGFDNSDAFAEVFQTKSGGGAVGVMAAVRNSYSGHNDNLAHGILTSFWPDYDDTHTTADYPNSFRVAEAMNFGKHYMYVYQGNTSTTETEFHLFHWFGDPEMAYRSVPPADYPVVVPGSISPDDTEIVVAGAPEGALIGVTQGDEVLGRGVSNGADTLISLLAIPNESTPLLVTVTNHNMKPYQADVQLSAIDLLIPDSAVEGDGTLIDAGTIILPETAASDVVVTLTSSDTSEIVVPASVTIPAGQTNGAFDIAIIDDTELDIAVTVSITASTADMGQRTARMTIIDNESATVSVDFASDLTEGDGTVIDHGTVTISDVVTQDVTFELTSDDLSEVTVPAMVTVEAGNADASFDVTVVNDILLDGDRTVTVSAGVTGWLSGSGTLIVYDDETVPPKLSLALPDTGWEGDVLEGAGTVSIPAPIFEDLHVDLASSDETELTVPSPVIITAGETWVAFDLTLIDDGVIDGNNPATVTATSPGWTSANDTMDVIESLTPPYYQDFSGGALPVDTEGFEYYSSNSYGRIRVLNQEMLMDSTSSGNSVLNEAVLMLNMLGFENLTLSFEQTVYSDETTNLSAQFTGHLNGDGVAISNDGNTWYTIVNGSALSSGTFTVDLDAEVARIQADYDPSFNYTDEFLIKFQQYDDCPYTTDGRGWDDIAVEGDVRIDLTVPALATEGDGVLTGAGLVELPEPATSDTTILLTSSDTTEVIVPDSVLIATGDTSAPFDITVVDDAELDIAVEVAITATLPGMGSKAADMTILDDESASVSVSFASDVTEGDGSIIGHGTVTISDVVTRDATFVLDSDDLSEITVPATVTVAAGTAGASFDVTVVDDILMDGEQTVTVSAEIAGWQGGSGTVVVHDNDSVPPNLSLSVPDTGWEGDILTAAGVVTIPAPIFEDLTVALSSDDETELTVPSAVTIPAGDTQVVFDLTLIDDGVIDGNQPVTVTATAAGWTSASDVINVIETLTLPYYQDFAASTLPADTEGFEYYSSNSYGRIRVLNQEMLMDSTTSGYSALNEAVLTLNMLGFESITLSFEQTIYSDETTNLSARFTGHVNGDGVSISNDGNTWYTIVNGSALSSGTFTIDLDAEVARIQTDYDPSFDYTDEFMIKFQQYDDYPYSTDGRGWDDIAVEGDVRVDLTIPASATEGDGVLTGAGLIALPEPATSDTTILLTSSDTTEVIVPDSVLIATGDISAPFDIAIVDDDELDIAVDVTITATIPGMGSKAVDTTILDDESASVSVTFASDVTEGDGTVIDHGTVTISDVVTRDATFVLASDDFSEITVPATVTVAAGTAGASFDVTVVDDILIDGDQTVTVSAEISGWHGGSGTVVVHDNDSVPPSLSLAVPDAGWEGDILTSAGVVTIPAPIFEDLTVALSSDDETELTVPSAVTIPAGDTQVVFDLTLIDDGVIDGNHPATVTATAAGWTSASDVINVIETLTLPYYQDFAAATLPNDIEGFEYYSSNSYGRIRVLNQEMLMDSTTSGYSALNEAVLTLNMLGFEKISLSFEQTVYSDETTNLSARFTGHVNGDGVSISNDGNTWYTIVNGGALLSRSFTIDLDAEVTRIQTDYDPSFDYTDEFMIKFQQYDDYPYSTDGRGWDDIAVEGDIRVDLTVPASATEGDGVLTGAGLIALPEPATSDTTILLTSSDTTEVIVPNSVLIATGDTSAPFDITIVDDAELDIAVDVAITATIPGMGSKAVNMTILDDESASVSVNFASDVTEGDGTVIGHGTVTISDVVTRDATFVLASDDLSEITVPATVTVAAGTAGASFDVTVVDDILMDGEKTVTVSADIAGWQGGSGIVVVHDNDSVPPNLSLTVPDTGWEGDILTAAGVVTIPAPIFENLTVALSSDDETELTVPSAVTIPAGDTQVVFDLTLIDDGVIDGNHPVTVTATAAGWTSASDVINVIETLALPYYQDFTASTLPTDTEGFEYYSSNSYGRIRVLNQEMLMDSTTSGYSALNEAVLTLNMLGFENITLSFEQTVYSDETTNLSARFTGHLNGDGVSISNDGNTWYTIVNGSALSSGTFTIDLDAEVARIQTDYDPSFDYTDEFMIKFQQYDDYPYSTDGRGWDNIAVEGNARLDITIPASATEGDGVLTAGGLIDLGAPAADDTTVALTSSDISEITVPDSVTVPAGDSTVEFDITVIDDTVIDGPQTVTVTANSNGLSTVSNSLIVEDNDTGTLVLDIIPSSASEGDGVLAGQGVVSTTITLTADLSVSLSADLADEISVPSTVVIPSGANSVSFDIDVIDDLEIDGTQSVTVTASAANHIDGSDTIDIIDNEVAALTLSVPLTVSENDGVLVGGGTIVLSGTLSSDLSVALSSDDTTELTVPTGVIVPAGQTSASFDLTVVDDTTFDGDQAATITASASGFSTVAETVIVTDNEFPSLTISVSPDTANEGEGSLVNAGIVTIPEPLSSDLVVGLNSNDLSEVTVPATVMLPAGQTAVSFDVTIIDDNVLDGAQTAMITASASGYTAANTTVTVMDDDVAVLTIQIAADTATEGDGTLPGAGTVGVGVIVPNDLVVTLEADPTDEISIPASVTIPAGSSSADFDITIIDDTEIDGTETVTLTVSSTGLTDASDIIDIEDNEVSVIALSIPATVSETDGVISGAGTVAISGTLTSDLSVAFQSDDTSEVVVPDSVVITAGQTSANFDITVVDDALLDGDQTVTVTAASNGFDPDSQSIVVIDDELPALTLTVTPTSLSEGDGVLADAGTISVPFAVTTDLTVALTSSDDSEASVPGSATIPSGQTAVTFDLTVVDDVLLDGDQVATISASAAGYTNDSVAVTVSDNETASLDLSIPTAATEGDGTTSGTVSIAGALASDLLVSLASNDTSELMVPASVTISAGQTSATFNLSVIDDVDADNIQSVIVTATASGFVAGTATMTVADNDPDHFVIDTFIQTQEVDVPFGISVSAIDASGATMSDYEGTVDLSGSSNSGAVTVTPSSFTFMNGQWNGSVTVSTEATDVVLIVDDGVGHSGQSNAFDVESDASDFSADLSITNDWGDGYCATLNVTNNAGSPTTSWTVIIDTAGTQVYTQWNGNFSGADGQVDITPVGWNSAIQPGTTDSSIGFCANRVSGGNAVAVVESATGVY